ncbi:MAG TPA: PHB depolymerase family esterase, partial [Acetobacteraceae bacterium]|nr:PHB depolymerase family esterase [Acetobacteraceae bacterium]
MGSPGTKGFNCRPCARSSRSHFLHLAPRASNSKVRMPPDFLRLMERATSLTRQGDLQSATAEIRAALAGQAAPTDAIDVESRWVPDEPRVQDPEPRSQRQPEQFIAGRFGTRAGARDYKLFVPAITEDSGPLPLVVMLHGCTQDPDDFAEGTQMNAAAREGRFLVLYPAQSQKANPQRCWNWFKRSHQGRERGEPALLAGMVRDVMARYPVDPARVYAAGLSAGGAMAAILAETHPELFAAVGVHSGLAAGAAHDLPSALQAMKAGAHPGARRSAAGVPCIVIHGDADTTVHPDNGRHAYGPATDGAASEESESGQAPGGRAWTRRVRRDGEGKVVAEYWVIHGAG